MSRGRIHFLSQLSDLNSSRKVSDIPRHSKSTPHTPRTPSPTGDSAHLGLYRTPKAAKSHRCQQELRRPILLRCSSPDDSTAAHAAEAVCRGSWGARAPRRRFWAARSTGCPPAPLAGMPSKSRSPTLPGKGPVRRAGGCAHLLLQPPPPPP